MFNFFKKNTNQVNKNNKKSIKNTIDEVKQYNEKITSSKQTKVYDFLSNYIDSFNNKNIDFYDYIRSKEAVDVLLSKFSINHTVNFNTLFIRAMNNDSFNYFLSCIIYHDKDSNLKIDKLKIDISFSQISSMYKLIAVANCVDHLDLSMSLTYFYFLKQYVAKQDTNFDEFFSITRLTDALKSRTNKLESLDMRGWYFIGSTQDFEEFFRVAKDKVSTLYINSYVSNDINLIYDSNDFFSALIKKSTTLIVPENIKTAEILSYEEPFNPLLLDNNSSNIEELKIYLHAGIINSVNQINFWNGFKNIIKLDLIFSQFFLKVQNIDLDNGDFFNGLTCLTNVSDLRLGSGIESVSEHILDAIADYKNLISLEFANFYIYDSAVEKLLELLKNNSKLINLSFGQHGFAPEHITSSILGNIKVDEDFPYQPYDINYKLEDQEEYPGQKIEINRSGIIAKICSGMHSFIDSMTSLRELSITGYPFISAESEDLFAEFMQTIKIPKLKFSQCFVSLENNELNIPHKLIGSLFKNNHLESLDYISIDVRLNLYLFKEYFAAIGEKLSINNTLSYLGISGIGVLSENLYSSLSEKNYINVDYYFNIIKNLFKNIAESNINSIEFYDPYGAHAKDSSLSAKHYKYSFYIQDSGSLLDKNLDESLSFNFRWFNIDEQVNESHQVYSLSQLCLGFLQHHYDKNQKILNIDWRNDCNLFLSSLNINYGRGFFIDHINRYAKYKNQSIDTDCSTASSENSAAAEPKPISNETHANIQSIISRLKDLKAFDEDVSPDLLCPGLRH